MGDLTNQYYSKYNKAHDKHGIDFDTVVPSYNFSQVAISGSQTSGTVQQILAVPQDTKFMKVSVATALISGGAQLQVVAGDAAVSSSYGSPNQVVANGTPLSAAITVPAAGSQTTVVCKVPDAVVSGLPLTLRAITAANNTATVQVSLVGVPVDPSPASDAQQSPYNNADPSNW